MQAGGGEGERAGRGADEKSDSDREHGDEPIARSMSRSGRLTHKVPPP
jgi:hypothetical protein